MGKQVQTQVKFHLLLGKTITPNQCRKLYKGDRLASIIHRLKDKGMDIDKVMVYNKDSQHAKYFLKKTPKKQP